MQASGWAIKHILQEPFDPSCTPAELNMAHKQNKSITMIDTYLY